MRCGSAENALFGRRYPHEMAFWIINMSGFDFASSVSGQSGMDAGLVGSG